MSSRSRCRPTAGLGRIGLLAAPVPLRAFAATVAAALPATAAGVRVAGERRPDGAAGRGVRRHRRTRWRARRPGPAPTSWSLPTGGITTCSSAVAETGIALIDVAHWASEWPWLESAAAVLRDGLEAQGRTVATAVSGQVTDPWRLHLP